MGEVQCGRVSNEGVHEASKGRGFKKRKEERKVERKSGKGGLSVKGEGVRWGEVGKGAGLPFLMILWYNCMKFYYSLLSPVPLPPSPDSMAPSRAVRMKRRTSSDVHFILGWPVTQGQRDREALAWPTASRHC